MSSYPLAGSLGRESSEIGHPSSAELPRRLLLYTDSPGWDNRKNSYIVKYLKLNPVYQWPMRVCGELISSEWNVSPPPIKWAVMIRTKRQAAFHVGMNRGSSSAFAAASDVADVHLQARGIASANNDIVNLTSLQKAELAA